MRLLLKSEHSAISVIAAYRYRPSRAGDAYAKRGEKTGEKKQEEKAWEAASADLTYNETSRHGKLSDSTQRKTL